MKGFYILKLPVKLLRGMPFDGGKGLIGYKVLDAAGILLSYLRVHAKIFEERSQYAVPLQDGLSYLFAFVGKVDMVQLIHGDELLFTQVFHGHADAGL